MSKTRLIDMLIGLTWSLSLLVLYHGDAKVQAQSLDEQLFEDLAAPASSTETPRSGSAPERRTRPSSPAVVGRNERRTPQGESLVLGETAKTMRKVSDRLAANDSTDTTRQMQQVIVDDLDRLIASLQEQQKNFGDPTPQSGTPLRSTRASPESKSELSNTNKPRSSRRNVEQIGTPRGQAETIEATTISGDQVMQESWGNLPSHLQQQMQSARPERFLPKYERLIEAYFQRLAEEDR